MLITFIALSKDVVSHNTLMRMVPEPVKETVPDLFTMTQTKGKEKKLFITSKTPNPQNSEKT